MVQILRDRTVPPLSSINPIGSMSISHWLEYSQLFSFFRSLPNKDLLVRDPTPLEDLLFRDSMPDYTLSVVYNMLVCCAHPDYTDRWATEVDISFLSEDWNKSFILT